MPLLSRIDSVLDNSSFSLTLLPKILGLLINTRNVSAAFHDGLHDSRSADWLAVVVALMAIVASGRYAMRCAVWLHIQPTKSSSGGDVSPATAVRSSVLQIVLLSS